MHECNRLVVLSGDIFRLFELLRMFMRDQRVLFYTDDLSQQEVCMVLDR